jgi:hypothetical protein
MPCRQCGRLSHGSHQAPAIPGESSFAIVAGPPGTGHIEQYQQKCAAVLRSELRENKQIEHSRDSEKNGNALDASFPLP